MGFVKHYGQATEYQGESFSKSLVKEAGNTWEATEEATYTLTDADGLEVSSGSLVKSSDDLSLTLTIPKADTQSLLGKYLLLVSAVHTDEPEFSDVIAEYRLEYIDRKAK